MSGTYDLADLFARLARTLEAAGDPGTTQSRVTEAAVEHVRGCDWAGMSLISRHGRIRSVAATDALVERVDAVQYELNEGPCLDTIADHVVYTIDNLRQESTKWPRFVPRAAEEGVASMLSFRLFTSEDAHGALNLYGSRPNAFTADSRSVGTILAAHAAVAMTAAREHERAVHLDEALHTSRQIGTAVGIIMIRQGLGQEEAFAFLSDGSQRLNRKIRDLADAIVAAGDLPRPAAH